MRLLKIALGLLLLAGGANLVVSKRLDSQLASFEEACAERCAEKQAGDPGCQPFCACVLEELRARHPSDLELVTYIHESDRQQREEGTLPPEHREIAQTCMERVRR